jgi:putative glutamine amidotransferase
MINVAMSMRVTEEESYIEKRDAISHDYIEYFEKLGCLVHLIPNKTTQVQKYFSNIRYDAIILTGGNNILSKKGLEEKSEISQIYPERDRTEFALIQHAIEHNIPLLGICRGMQTINVFFGGELSYFIMNHVAKTHLLCSTKAEYNSKEVNSFHKIGIRKEELATGFRILASTEDGFLEAIKHKNKKIFAVQWHPERPKSDAFIDEIILNFLKGIK